MYETKPIDIDPTIHVSVSECGIRLASAGYAVFGMDYEGHGRSMGARCYIKKFGNIVNDCYDYYTSICGIINIYITTSQQHSPLFVSSSPVINSC